MRTLMSDSKIADQAIDEIADSASIWWGVQREIAKEHESRVASPWPPPKRWLKMLFFGAPLTAAVLLLAFLTLGRWADAERPGNSVAAVESEKFIAETELSPAPAISQTVTEEKTTTADPASNMPARAIVAKKIRPSVVAKAVSPTTKKNNETVIKSDFIALSYSGVPSSGQLVRVRVPSSMMVTLGLVSSVEKPSNMVDAEVIVGDDGMTHSIRFIR